VLLPPSCRRKLILLDCIILIVIVLVIVLPIIFVAIPKKAQSEINASTLEVTSQEVTNPQPDGVNLKLTSVIRSDSSYHPTVDSFEAELSLEGQDEPFTTITIPQAKSEAETHITVDQPIKFASKDAFALYTKTVLGAETFKVHLDGKTQVHLKGLPGMDVNYNKVVTMKGTHILSHPLPSVPLTTSLGLNRLSGLNITSLRILQGVGAVLADGSNLIGNVSIPNPSVMTLDLGNVTMNLAVDGTSLGYALIPNLVLKPGENVVPMQAHADQLVVIGLITSKYKNAILPLTVTGNSSVKDGVHLSYYEEAIKSNVVKVDLNVGPALKAINLTLPGLG